VELTDVFPPFILTMKTFDRKKFFDTYRNRFGQLTQPLVDALDFLIDQIEQDERFSDSEKDRLQLAYCLATFKLGNRAHDGAD
jgi:putative chitinase